MAHNSRFGAALAVGIALAACGPSETGGSGTTAGTSGAMLGTSSEGYDGSESTVAGTTSSDCAEVYVGDLVFNGSGPHDVSALDHVWRVEGNIGVNSTDFVDLSFFGCVREVTGNVVVRSNDSLESLSGLERLEVADEIWIEGNQNLIDIGDVGPIKELTELSISSNPLLDDLGFDSLEKLERLKLGDGCGYDQGEFPPPDMPPALVEISGFDSLAEIGTLTVSGQLELASLGRLHEIAAAGGLQDAGFYNNLELPYAEIEQLEAEAGLDFDACGNLDGPEPSCRESDQFPSVCIAP